MDTHAILRIEEVTKAYERHVAVDKVSFEVPRGAIFGLLGPNGAGKTSLIRIITTITRPDSGVIYLDGMPLDARHPEQIGYMPEERGLYKKMKVGEHLMYLAQLKGLGRADAKRSIGEWMEKFDIVGWWDKKVEELSKGMQQKIQFIATVVHRPQLLILDEPFSGLDPINTNLIKEEIFKMHESGVSIIFSTHRMEQVEEVCENIALINKGKKILEGNVGQIKQHFKKNLFRIEYSGVLPSDFSQFGQIQDLQEGALTIQVSEAVKSNQLLQYLLNEGIYIQSFKEILPTLNEIFITQVEGSNQITE